VEVVFTSDIVTHAAETVYLEWRGVAATRNSQSVSAVNVGAVDDLDHCFKCQPGKLGILLGEGQHRAPEGGME